MFYRRRELQRLWEVEVFDGDPEDPDVTTHKETVIAWNHVDATRKAGKHVATPPVELHFVTWPDTDENIFRINNTSEGPVGDPVNPSMAVVDLSEEDWK